MVRIILLTLAFSLRAFALPAFPGAEGYGADTKGGRGGKVYNVTTLASSGKGSFAEALHATEPRIIVFRVSGVIDLKTDNDWYLSKENSFVTIAGQTSPGGITLTSSTNGSSIIMCYQGDFHDGIWRFLRFRGREHNEDGLTLNQANNFILDHMDFSGAGDETLDITASHDFTVQWSTISNSSKGQTYGFLMAYLPTSHISLHHNLMANHVYRFPEMHWAEGTPPDNGKIDYRNNVLYNGEKYFLYAEETAPKASVQMNVVGNYFKGGPQTPADWLNNMVYLESKITAYGADNITATKAGAENTTSVNSRMPNAASAAFATAPVTTLSAKDAYAKVLDKVGAFPRDAMNTRTVNEVRTGTGQFQKDNDALLSGGPNPPVDTDLDGMPDEWETAMGLNPNSAADNVLDQDNDGYTNVEEYLNDLALVWLGEAPLNAKGAGAIHVGIQGAWKKDGSRRMKMDRDGRHGVLRIELPASAREGVVEIADCNGHTLARFPARAQIAWDYAASGTRPAPGLCLVRWLAGGHTLESAKVQIL